MRLQSHFTCVVAAFAVLAGQAFAQQPDGPAPGAAHEHGHQHAQSHDDRQSNKDMHDTAGAHHHGHDRADGGGADAALVTRPRPPRSGERTTLTFTLTNGAGRPLERLITHHARKLHVVIVSEDMQVLGHIHPQDFGEPIEGGEATAYFSFPRAGRYLVAADIMTEAGPYAEQFVVEVAGDVETGAGAALPARVAVVESEGDDRYTAPVVTDGADQADGYRISVAAPARIEAGEPATFTFHVTRGGALVTDLRPFLDAPLHLAVVREDLAVFVHEHGAVAEANAAGRSAHGSQDHDGGSGHGAHDDPGPASFGPELMATITFPEPGRYYLFGQAARGDKLLISRFPVEVRER